MHAVRHEAAARPWGGGMTKLKAMILAVVMTATGLWTAGAAWSQTGADGNTYSLPTGRLTPFWVDGRTAGFLDAEVLQGENGLALRRIYQVMEQPPNAGPDISHQAVQLVNIDCAHSTILLLHTTGYSKIGMQVFSVAENGTPGPIVAGTYWAGLQAAVCQGVGVGPQQSGVIFAQTWAYERMAAIRAQTASAAAPSSPPPPAATHFKPWPASVPPPLPAGRRYATLGETPLPTGRLARVGGGVYLDLDEGRLSRGRGEVSFWGLYVKPSTLGRFAMSAVHYNLTCSSPFMSADWYSEYDEAGNLLRSNAVRVPSKPIVHGSWQDRVVSLLCLGAPAVDDQFNGWRAALADARADFSLRHQNLALMSGRLVLVGADPQGLIFLYEASPSTGQELRVVSYVVYAPGAVSNGPAQAVFALGINCQGGTYHYLSVHEYDAAGAKLAEPVWDEVPIPFDRAPPVGGGEPAFAGAARAACGYAETRDLPFAVGVRAAFSKSQQVMGAR